MSKKHTIEHLRQAVEKALPDKVTPQTSKLAESLFDRIDDNQNGYASLAEIDKGLRFVIKVPQIPGLHTMELKAFNKARTVKKSNKKVENDYVSRDEFIYMLVYLRAYYQFYMEFRMLDENDDQQISFKEFQKGKGVLKRWKIDTSNLIGTFKQMDRFGGGTISFRQFCLWAIDKYFKAEFGTSES